MNNQSVFILGAGGHTKVLLDCLLSYDHINILGILDINVALQDQTLKGIPIFCNEQDFLQSHTPETMKLVNGIGSIALPLQRLNIFKKFKNKGFDFVSAIHSHAYIAKDVILGEGVQIMAGSIMQSGCQIGNNVIINTRASIDHDCHVGDHVHLAPGVVCCGDVIIGEGSHIGSGAVILQGITIGNNSLIAAGAVVTSHCRAFSRIAGVPAKEME